MSTCWWQAASALSLLLLFGANFSAGQLQAGVFDFGESRHGERRGSWTPSEWLACVLVLMVIVLGFVVSIGMCYYVNKRQQSHKSGRLRKSNIMLASNDPKNMVMRKSELYGERLVDPTDLYNDESRIVRI